MISKSDIEHLKDLARVELGEHESDILIKDLDSILNYVDTLKEANVDNVQETTHAFDMKNIVRADKFIDDTKKEYTNEVEAIIEAFPEKEKTYLKVKAIF